MTAAAKLGVSGNTIATHMRHVYEKLHAHSKSKAVAKALRGVSSGKSIAKLSPVQVIRAPGFLIL